ncbi:MAG: DUF2194 domain-containing protein [Fervidobacterium sp.]
MKSRILRLVLVFLFLVLFSILFSSKVYSKALLLYKNSEQGYGYNILVKYVASELKNLSLTYDIVDVESEAFLNIDMSGYEFIATCYYSPIMPNAKNYLKRLYEFLLSGGKLLVINNIGATIDTSGSNHPTLAEINSVYNLLGVSYSYGWKKVQPKEILIDKYYLSVQNPVYLSERDVEIYQSISPYTKPIVSVKSSDDKMYDVGFVGPLGAIISYNYFIDDNGKISIDISKIIETLLYGNSHSFKILVLGKANSILSKALDYTLLRYDWRENIPSNLSTYDAIILLDGQLPITDANLTKYILSGGTVLVTSKGNKTVQVSNLKIDSNIFPVPPEFSIQIRKNISYVEPFPGAVGLIFSAEGDTLSWKTTMGTGQLIYYPSELVTKSLRGVLIQTLFSQLPFSIQPIVNSFSVYLDDFPLPAYRRKIDVITKEFGDITDNEFYYNIWWPTMKKISEHFNLKYTSIFVANYNASVTWPFSFQEYINTPEQRIMLDELMRNNIEIGLHGYNHIPLTNDRWDSERLKDVLKTFKIFIKNTLGEEYIPYTYVAPDNIIDNLGISQLLEIFPSIKVIGTTYKTESTENAYEFSVVKQGTVIVPRTTSGYYPLSKIVTESVLGLMTLGTYQYFLHPDDIFSKDRNPDAKTWTEMSQSLIDFFSTMTKYYPYLRNHFSFESGEIIYDFLTQRPFIEKQSGKISVRIAMGYHLPRYYYVRSRSPFKLSGGRIVFNSNNLYVIEQFENIMEILFVK